jgi:hypothetical protein
MEGTPGFQGHPGGTGSMDRLRRLNYVARAMSGLDEVGENVFGFFKKGGDKRMTRYRWFLIIRI